MGLTSRSTGTKAMDSGLKIHRHTDEDKVIAIAGNPNVGKSTLFNGLTKSHQHTGNWPGKTVANAQGWCRGKKHGYVLVDIPGTYSLMAHSAEEEVARNFICFGENDGIIVVCDATCLERNLNLVLQVMEISNRVLVCVNLMDEARRKEITVDLQGLSQSLGVPVVGTTARKKQSLAKLLENLDLMVDSPAPSHPIHVTYDPQIEKALSIVEPVLKEYLDHKNITLNSRWLASKLIDPDETLLQELKEFLKEDILKVPQISEAISLSQEFLKNQGISQDELKDRIVLRLVKTGEELARQHVRFREKGYNDRDRKIDQILTSRLTGYPVMLCLLAFIFWLTISVSNYPSSLLSALFFKGEVLLDQLFVQLGAPGWLHSMMVSGMYRVLGWVISVMLPPMAIFFPLFTLLEDSGYLPRIAYNLDKPFKCCRACGKQALTMCMGFGCNAAGIVGCRIIDSPREQLIAMLTNSFVPCNGRFPTLIAIIVMFFTGISAGFGGNVLSALLLTFFILLGILLTFAVSALLSITILKGMPSSFTLELPPYRRPQIGKVLIRSIFDRTLFVLGRAVAVAAPAGILLWVMANVSVDGFSLLAHCAIFLDPFARLLGMDGVILIAFILGLPANEIVMPIIIMAYLSEGSLTEFNSLGQLKDLLAANGWTWITAVSTMLFSLFHWPCSTTLLTIRKETGSWKWTFVAFFIPLLCGILLCMVFSNVAALFL